MNNLIEIGKIIKQKRLDLNMTMDYCAKMVGITRATLWAIENGNLNYHVGTLIKLLDMLNLDLTISNNFDVVTRSRATRINKLIDKKINRFVIMCVEEYASSINKESSCVYKRMKEKGVIDNLINDYEDLHGYSKESLNEYIDSLIEEV